MRLTKLELTGFKSFARKTELDFGNGITAVIGPNGSGKSNIADAIRWVLGEQNARNLRGSRMEDVIFSGTAQRKSQGYCEVILTFDNEDGKLSLPYREIAVTRRLYRSGDSEYCINGAACRLRDVQELFRDTGIGKDGYSIISQGRVDEILSNKSNERRAALEEAAGVMRYRVRKEDAARKLEHTEKNLERIDDIIRELEERLGPLEEQSRTARSYLKLRDELKDLEINQFLYQYDRAKDRISSAENAAERLRAEQADTEARTEMLRETCEQLELRCAGTEKRLSEEQNGLIGMLSDVEAHIGENKVLLERKERFQSEIDRLTDEEKNARARAEALSATVRSMNEDTAAGAALSQLAADIAAASEALSGTDAELSETEREVEEKKNAIMDAMNFLADAKGEISRFETMTASVHARLSAAAEEIGRLDKEREALNAERAEAEKERCALTEACEKTEREASEAAANRERLKREHEEAAARSRSLEQQTGAAESRLRVLTEMIRNREGYYHSVRSVMRDAEKDPALAASVIGVVAELIRVPEAYETAINMALGSALQNIVTPTAEDARRVIEHLRKNDYGRATMLPIALLRKRPLDENERRLLRFDGCLGAASELIECDETVRPAAEYLLGRTAVVRDLDSGIALKKRAGSAFQIATLDGDIIGTGGAMSGGSMKKQQSTLLGREREAKELSERIEKQKAALAESNAACEALRKQILTAELQTEAFRDEIQRQKIELTRNEEKLDIIQRDIRDRGEERAALDEETAALNENLADIRRQWEETVKKRETIESGNTVSREDVRLAQQRLTALRAERERMNDGVTELKLRQVALQKERNAAEAERKRMDAERADCERRAADAENARKEKERLLMEILSTVDEASGDIRKEQDAVEERRAVIRKTEEERAEMLDALSARRTEREKLLSDMRALDDQLHRQEMAKSRAEMELSQMQDRIWDDYELTYENALPFRRPIAIGAVSGRVNEIRSEIREMGDVNLSAIEDYRAVSERFTTLSGQRDDLRKAEADLNRLILELTDAMQKVFSAGFREIQKNFGETFKELFGGGSAELRLSDPEQVLDCDIDIIAQPPGKKLQLLSLLSGGERALTAIALLFALLRLKPPAFCVLDEIESSLDEANVSRFAEYLRDYSEGTQFIIITHRKGSMEVCDSLYGVSMEERGVSKVVSAKFGEAAEA